MMPSLSFQSVIPVRQQARGARHPRTGHPLKKEALVAELSEFPTASAKDTISFCWKQVEDQKAPLVTSWVVMVLAVIMADVVCPLIFASILGRVASIPPHSVVSEWHRFGPLLLAYGIAGLIAMVFWRVAGWLEWGACVRSFAQGLNNGYRHLLELSYRWHMDHPAGEVISSLGNFSWAFVEMVDVASWGLLPVAVVVVSALAVLSVTAWPAALALLVMVGLFVVVLARRLPQVRAASQQFEDHHSKATGVVADTVTNLMTVRSAAAEPHERYRVEDLMQQSVDADLRARSIFTRTQLQLETSIVLGTLLALVAGTSMAVHHWASTATLYLILYYSRPGGAQPPAVVRASAFVRPLSWPGRKVRGHIGRRDRDQQSTRRPKTSASCTAAWTSAMCPSATGPARPLRRPEPRTSDPASTWRWWARPARGSRPFPSSSSVSWRSRAGAS